ncbi:hypothetical protein JOL79_33585 [Microbispora sp. RL4-1S]|uniref:Uncharacterized protein n=1 Tax=Microbispora oryzae TaxID=2806554 RepID=A0A940WS95_9ACTN|nr:hypothetical protein [Microbispora oryzae]MBP2708712.1 hypothetical protein [Microbispora oryzae]
MFIGRHVAAGTAERPENGRKFAIPRLATGARPAFIGTERRGLSNPVLTLLVVIPTLSPDAVVILPVRGGVAGTVAGDASRPE